MKNKNERPVSIPIQTLMLNDCIVAIPASFLDIETIITTLKSQPIVVRLNIVEADLAQRFLDFLSGAIFALDGTVKRISQTDYLFTPRYFNVVQSYG